MNTAQAIPPVIFSLLLITAPTRAALEMGGYFENRIFTATGGDHRTGGYNSLRIRFFPDISEKINLESAVNFISPYGFWPGHEISILDRAYVDFYSSRFDLTIGRQRISWGTSYIWAPLDVFNRVNLIEPKGEREGVNAVRVYVPFGRLSGASAAFAPEGDIPDSRKGIRVFSNLYGVDLGLSFITGRNERLLGMDLRGDLEVGWWAEIVRLWEGDGAVLKGVMGLDYTFEAGNGLYVLCEYYHDESGEPDRSRYDFSKLAERNTLARDYLFSLSNYPLRVNLTLSASLTVNLNDNTGILNPYIRYDIFQDVSLTFGAYIFYGPEGGEFQPTDKVDPSGIMGSDMLFSWLRVDF